MATKFPVGHRIGDYTITKFLRKGSFALSYMARTDDGREVFFKQYVLPSYKHSWYRDFIRYQHKLTERLNRLPPVLVHTPWDLFEEDGLHFQVFELLEGQSLQKYTEHIDVNGETAEDLELLDVSSKLFMFAITQVHRAGVVHCDLKLDNAFMVNRDDTELGKAVKLIDFDFSFFADDPPPWVPRNDADGRPGYVGTLSYHSPEQLLGSDPSFASDVFTCGVMLYQLLVGTHPARLPDGLSVTEYNRRYVEAFRSGGIESPAVLNSDIPPHVSDTIDRMLAFDPAVRPTASEAHASLLRRMADQVNLLVEGGSLYKPVCETAEIGQSDLRQFPSYRYVSKPQFRIIKDEENSRWLIEGLRGTTNNTRLNGEKITGRTVELNEGDVVSVGPFETTVQLK